MLAHGTGVRQWQAVIVSLCLGGLCMPDTVVDGSMTPFVDESSVTKLMAHGKSRLKEKIFAYDFVASNMATGAQEYYPIAYHVEEGYPATFNATIEEDFWDMLMEPEKSRLRQNFFAYGFVAANIAHGAQEYYLIAYLTEEDHLGTFYAITDVNFDDCDLFDQVDYDGHFEFVFDRSVQWSQRQDHQKRIPSNPDFCVLCFCLFSNILYAKWKNEHAMRMITKSSNWVALEQPRRVFHLHIGFGFTSILFWLILLGLCVPALGVTCQTCFDGIPGCTGGADCLFATRTAANAAALTVAGGAAINVISLLPASYIRHLPTQVLRSLAAIARVPAADGPPDLGAMSLTELQECLASGRIEVSAFKAELSARLADGATVAAQVTRISAMLVGIQSTTTTANPRIIDGINSYGVLGYLVAAASLIVNSGKRTYSSGVAGSSTSGGSSTSLSIQVPTSGSQFAELLMVWQTLAHAVGAANILATVPFLQQVVWDGISTLGLLWEQAYCLFIIYLEAIEDSRGVLNLANVFAAGAQDTRLKAANQRYSQMFCQTCDDQDDKDKEKDKGANKWNNRDSPNANGICKTYNFRDAEHPKKHLFKDGTCKFRHVCNHWVTGKGAGGMCEGNHPKYACNNPNKTNTKPTQ